MPAHPASPGGLEATRQLASDPPITRPLSARWIGQIDTSGACIARIGAFRSGTFVEFDPADSNQIVVTTGGGPGTRAVERSRRLSSGTYTIVFQYRDSSGACEVDDWHFAVEQDE